MRRWEHVIYRLLIFVFLASFASEAQALCVCSDAATENEAVARASIVFVGTVISIQRVRVKEHQLERMRIVFRVEGSIKNVSAEKQIIETSLGSFDCGYPFEVDRQYVVFADSVRDTYVTTICSHTSPIGWVPDVLKH